MRLLFIATILFGIALAQDQQRPSAPPEPSFVPETGQVFYLDLDSPEGALSQWRHDDLGSLSALQATISVPAIRDDPKWAPAFALWLQNTDSGHVRNRVGVEFSAPNRKPPLTIRIVQSEGKQLTTVATSSQTLDLNEKLSIRIAWPKPNLVSIAIGDSETHQVNITWPINSAAVTGSTGEVMIDRLLLGRIAR